MAYSANIYSPYAPQQFQPTVPQPIWGYQAGQPINALVSVTGLEGAKAYQLPPNSSIALFDGNADLMYVKTTDAAGYPTIRTFRFEPVEQAPAPQADYVSREDFDALVKRVEELSPAKIAPSRYAKDAEAPHAE